MSTPETQPKETGHPILLYDGVCGLCHGLVQFVLPRDKENLFYFASLQSDYARDILIKHKRDPDALNTFYIALNRNTPSEKLLSKSSAAIFVMSKLGPPFAFAPVLRILPPFFRDAVYDYVAANRYKWFGKHEVCMAPTASDKERFVG